MQPYREALVYETNAKVAATYAEAQAALDAQYPVWIARTMYDYCAGLSWSASENKHLAELRAALGLQPPPVTTPLLRTRGTTLIDADTGRIWKQKGVSAFRLFDDYVNGRDIDAYCQWAVSRRLNLLRVFQMYAGALGRLVPSEVPGYYEKLAYFLDHVGSFGLSVELTCFADMQTDTLHGIDPQRHYLDTMDVILGRHGVMLEICNEPFKNGLDPTTVYQPFSEVIQALGLYTPENGSLPHGEYITVHSPRDDEWPRKGGKDLLELSRLGLAEVPALQIPATEDEPMGIGPDEHGRRSMDLSDHAEAHALCALFGSGSTIHGDFGIACRLPTSEEDAIVQAVVQSWEAIPPACQTWNYTAGHLAGCPLVDTALRTFAMTQGGHAFCVRIRPTAPAEAQNGWRIISQQGYEGCVVELVK